MFGWLKSKDKTAGLQKQYQKLMKEAFDLSKTDRQASDLKYAEADKIMSQIEKLKQEAN